MLSRVTNCDRRNGSFGQFRAAHFFLSGEPCIIRGSVWISRGEVTMKERGIPLSTACINVSIYGV